MTKFNSDLAIDLLMDKADEMYYGLYMEGKISLDESERLSEEYEAWLMNMSGEELENEYNDRFSVAHDDVYEEYDGELVNYKEEEEFD